MSLYFEINMLRQLYELVSHPGVKINRWIYADPDQQPEREQSMLLPQLTLHTSGGTVLDSHVYGRLAVAQVYGTVTATQEILDSPAGGAGEYPWARFYARRFGNTTVSLKLDSPTIAGSSVEITPTEFDELDEIIDGWKEVTLEFDTPPSMGTGTNPQWRWSAAGEMAGNRWEVLGTYAPALSGTPGNFNTFVPAPNQLSLGTYGAPVSGANINLGWIPGYAPTVSSTTDDQTADAILMFGQYGPLITGFGSSIEEQEITGIGLDCGLDPCCVPSALDYVEVSWETPVNTDVAEDTFTRTESGTWGTPDVGPAYTYSGVVGDFSVDGSQGLVTFSFSGGANYAVLPLNALNFDATVDVTYGAVPTSGVLAGGIVARFTTNSDTIAASARIGTDGAMTVVLDDTVGGVQTTLGSYTTAAGTLAAGSTVHIRLTMYGSFVKMKVWEQYTPEPDTWNIEATTTNNAFAGTVGIIAVNTTPITGQVVGFDNFIIGPPDYWFGYYELQRMDTVTTDWQTIMKATSPSTTVFNDYEARVGILTSYRIRVVDLYDFPGQWSSTITATIPEPGVTIGCEDGHLLIFTSNEQQDGSLNLAYSSVWENQVEESFVFPEARFVELQAMYNRDFFVAFRTMERGGEQFSRTVLVQAAAISPETLADFTSLRDMAWADVSYICVRDEDGNRWFATILVPGGRVLRDRRLYLAPVEIIEVTDTPSQTDP